MYSTKGNLRYDRFNKNFYDKDGDIVKIIEVDSKHTTVDNSKSRSQIASATNKHKGAGIEEWQDSKFKEYFFGYW